MPADMTPAPYLQHLPGFSSANELGLFFEGALGVVLTGLNGAPVPAGLAQRAVVVLNIPLAILASVTALGLGVPHFSGRLRGVFQNISVLL